MLFQDVREVSYSGGAIDSDRIRLLDFSPRSIDVDWLTCLLRDTLESVENGAESGEEARPPEKNGCSDELEEVVDDVTLEVGLFR